MVNGICAILDSFCIDRSGRFLSYKCYDVLSSTSQTTRIDVGMSSNEIEHRKVLEHSLVIQCFQLFSVVFTETCARNFWFC